VILPAANHEAFNQMPDEVTRLMMDFFRSTSSDQE
jgi:hypothetical protein